MTFFFMHAKFTRDIMETKIYLYIQRRFTMNAIYELKAMREKIWDEKIKLEKELEKVVASEKLFVKHPYAKKTIKAKIELLDELDKWTKAELRKAILIAETEL